MPSLNGQLVKPPALRAGDTIGVVAPASNIKQAGLAAGCEALRRDGYRVVYENSILDQDLYFAGSLERRVREFEDMFTRDDVRAVLCARGGYGANYLLPRVDWERIKAHPKIFIGYSDITCLLTHLIDAWGVVAFHGPMAVKDWNHADGVDLASWQAALGNAPGWDVGLSADVSGLLDGEAEGILYGGCLSILVASLGTPYAINTEGTILFIEDVAAKPYQIDRMLMQLKLGGYLNGVRGIVFGQMLECVQAANQPYTLREVIMRIVGDLGIPVAYGVKSGHVTSGNITLPFGVRAKLSVAGSQVNLRMLEASVS
jgi:muramoyltetrapeptide carboxypeptidase